MTDAQYRNSTFRQELAEFLSTPAGINLIVILKDGAYLVDPPNEAPDIASVRVLSQAVGFNKCLQTMLLMCEPNEQPVEPIKETWEDEKPPAEPGTM